MKSLALYLESMFKNPIDAANTIDLDKIMNKIHDEKTFAEGYAELLDFVKDAHEKEISSDKYDKIKDTNCYVLFATNIDTDELENPPFLINLYDGTDEKTIHFGGSYMEIDGEHNMIGFKTDVKNECNPASDIKSMDLVGALDITLYEVTPETINLIKSSSKWLKECDSSAATPANTMGEGNPTLPTGENSGSGDLFVYDPKHPSTKKEKKDKSKTHKK
jgi:hypothetical protein